MAIERQVRNYRLDSTDSVHGRMVLFCEYFNEHSGHINDQDSLYHLSDNYFV